ncbi:MAG: hypothetical protein IPN81_11040 [Nitrosomonadales bacterium]|jgi:hypothetical protein|nr:hypothetical protein [Nitrosomonadales bacterium]MBL0039011.1 hypothetical protein [Nitrosomonadales bacterium]
MSYPPKRKPPNVPTKTEWIGFNGGLDTDTPAMQKASGVVIVAQNLEHGVNGGYDTMEGYERFDGQARPSDAQYAILDCLLTSTVSVGDVVTDSTGAIFGTVIALTVP